MAETFVQRFAEVAAELRETGPPAELASDLEDRVLDVVGNALAAWGEGSGEAVLELVSADGGRPEASVIGAPGRHPAAHAAFVNGTLAHTLDFDDTHLPSVLHPSASVVPAALAMGETVGAPGPDVLTAILMGDELAVRLGAAAYDPKLRNSVFFERGFHATSICGTLGAACAAAMLLGLDRDGIAHAIGIAASMGAGIIEANRTGGTVKRIHCGWAAQSGIVAARLAAGGLTGPPSVLEGRFGFFAAYTDGFLREDALAGDLGERWETVRVFYKPYPTNHFTHAGIDAALALRRRGIDPDDIVALELGVPAPVLRTIAEPADVKAAPPTGYAARFSGPFTVAAALLGGGGLGVYLDDFSDETVREPRHLRLARLVRCHPDPVCTDVFPHQFPAILTARLRDGSEVRAEVLTTRGGPERPLTREELATKFRLNAARRLPNEDVSAWERAIRSLHLTDASLPGWSTA